MRRLLKFLKYLLLFLVALFLVLVVIYYLDVQINEPDIDKSIVTELRNVNRNEVGKDSYKWKDNWLRKNEYGLWELYLEGDAFERGMAFGTLAYELNEQKEKAFLDEIRNRVPSEGFLNFLKYLVAWINRDLDDYISDEFLKEIYGSSLSMPDKYDYVGPKFHRILNYHAAHDIGHALQNMNLVGCTAFAIWDEQTDSSNLLIGRNFDFYFGQEFAKDKIVAFYNPEQGYKFISVTWACFSGVVSGMNEHGLTVTLNSAKSPIPIKGKTPVSLIAREILQYATTIEEAYKIAQSHESFVSETFLIGSKIDGRVGLIEKTGEITSLYYSDSSRMIVTNHFQSDELVDVGENIEYRSEGVSDYRYNRVGFLLDSLGQISVDDVAFMLRDKNGLNGDTLGLGNEKAINQLIAHHSVIFSPNELKMWVSASPYVLGTYVCYDLNKVFSEAHIDNLDIKADTFLTSNGYANYEVFLKYKEQIQTFLFQGSGLSLSQDDVKAFLKSNPNSYLTYFYLGDYFKEIHKYQEAIEYYKIGLTKNIARTSEQLHMEQGIQFCEKQLD